MGAIDTAMAMAGVAATGALTVATLGKAEIALSAALIEPSWPLGAHRAQLVHVEGPVVRVTKVWGSLVDSEGHPLVGSSHRCRSTRLRFDARAAFGRGDVILVDLPSIHSASMTPKGIRFEAEIRPRPVFPTSRVSTSIFLPNDTPPIH